MRKLGIDDLLFEKIEIPKFNSFYSPGKRGFYSPVQGRATPERLNAFRNVGRLMGLCLLQNELCPLFFNRHVIKHLLSRKVRFHDLAFFDPVIYESLRQLVVDAENKVSKPTSLLAKNVTKLIRGDGIFQHRHFHHSS